ncbi:uncharacterized protein MONOS_18494 [Monocercomonoides exilis]|uniref:uncharacterized protein n=1 Tax=Monocercomonoides exilis TaxID=2049356 RepID=UPI003559966C|nr:hypothetical protein MONOS_18494 [Monocercomonoides exilis]
MEEEETNQKDRTDNDRNIITNSIHENLQSLVNALTLIVLVILYFWQHLPLNVSFLYPSIRIIESLRTSLNRIPSMLNSIWMEKTVIDRVEMLLQSIESADKCEGKEREEGEEVVRDIRPFGNGRDDKREEEMKKKKVKKIKRKKILLICR